MQLTNNTNGNYITRQLKLALDIEKLIDCFIMTIIPTLLLFYRAEKFHADAWTDIFWALHPPVYEKLP